MQTAKQILDKHIGYDYIPHMSPVLSAMEEYANLLVKEIINELSLEEESPLYQILNDKINSIKNSNFKL